MPTFKVKDFDLNELGNTHAIDVAGNSYATVQLPPVGTAPTTAVITLRRSNDGLNFVDLEGAPPSSTIGPSPGMTNKFSVEGFRYLGLVVTTAEGSALLATLYVHVDKA